MHTAKDIARLLSDRAEDVCALLLPSGRRKGAYFVTGDIEGTNGQSLKCCLSGANTGLWNDFADGGEKGGDLLDLWARVYNLPISEAMGEAAKWLGLPDDPLAKPTKSYHPAPENLKVLSLEPGAVRNWLTGQRLIGPRGLDAYAIEQIPEHTVVFPRYKNAKLVGRKYRNIHDKHDQTQDADCEPCLFGWQAIPPEAREVIICEGELDALAWFDSYKLPALSVPNGAGALQWIENDWEELARFDDIFLSFDMDEEGQKVIPQIIERLGRHRCRIIKLPYKDANECLTAEKPVLQAEMLQFVEHASTSDPAELKRNVEFTEGVDLEFNPKDEIQRGVKLPWSKTYEKIRLRPSEISLWTGVNGHGKSQLLGQLCVEAVAQGHRCLIASMEMAPRKTLARMYRQITCRDNLVMSDIEQVAESYNGHIWIYDILDTINPDRLIEVAQYGRRRYGITQIVIDSLVKCGIREEDYEGQKQFVDKLCLFKNTFEVHVHLIAHSRKHADESHIPGKLDVKGSGSLTDLVDNVFTLWRNKPKEEALAKSEMSRNRADQKAATQPDARLICQKQRNGEWEGGFSLWWNAKSFQFVEGSDKGPRQYLKLDEIVPF